jgi:hypothetical protein
MANVIRLHNDDPDGPNEWWLRNIVRIQRENPNYCADKYAVFRTHRCGENEREEIIQVAHPTRGYMVQDVCKRCQQPDRRNGRVRRGREDSDSDVEDEPAEPVAAFTNRRQRALPAPETMPDPDFLNRMINDEDPRAAAREARLAAIERRRAADAQPAVRAPPHPPVGVNARALIAQAREEARQQRANEERRRALRESLDRRRQRVRNELAGRPNSSKRNRKYTRFGGMAIFTNTQKAPPCSLLKNKRTRNAIRSKG